MHQAQWYGRIWFVSQNLQQPTIFTSNLQKQTETPWTNIYSPSVDMSTTDPTEPPTIAPFSTVPSSRSSFQVHQKSPLLVATPPNVTRALSKAFPWVRALDRVVALLTWTSADPWESFLLVSGFWAITLYGDFLLRWVGGLVIVAAIIGAMVARRWHFRDEGTTLDEILATLNRVNDRISVLFSPFISLLNVLSSQKPDDATSATTRPALTRMAIRVAVLTPVWLSLAVWPLNIITPRRIVLFIGTLLLTWHSRPAKVSRTILWRSATFRYLSEQLTGLTLAPPPSPPALPPRDGKADKATADRKDSPAATTPSPAAASLTRTLNTTVPPTRQTTTITPTTNSSPGVKFTFSIYENQRRWLGVGWTSTLFPNERLPWTDEHLQPCPSPDDFELPPTVGEKVHWRWVEGEDWEVEGAVPKANTLGVGTANASTVSVNSVASTHSVQDGKYSTKQDFKDKLGGPGEQGEGWWRAELVEGEMPKERRKVPPAYVPKTEGAGDEGSQGEAAKKPSPPELPKRERRGTGEALEEQEDEEEDAQTKRRGSRESRGSASSTSSGRPSVGATSREKERLEEDERYDSDDDEEMNGGTKKQPPPLPKR
ncbi:Similar to Peroxisomal membrane protein PEX30; acc. no. Q06169 [Pyronema omphalodes CBS 100304]|uniref:Similar to Peroxisomal membrane protein PEX30 acc. no. Q06169 n=1 Tax=Pyronema omphalodes (strain CBS 100304) TaxID=1076935 RepID=U4LBX8_PYROM|nr:Similar to Peroxisomal membrane protein PEX30; acc. no. Q06169 [Pyronema omphalodes CBS 100304]